MSKTIQGTVSRTGKSKYSYFVLLDGENFYYNTKFEPKCSEGDEVKILFEQKAENRGNIKKLKVVTKGTPSPKRGGGNEYGGRGDNRQDSIVWQHSQEMAVRLVQAQLAAGAVTLKGNDDAKRTLIDAMVAEYTVLFFNEALDPRNSKTYKDVQSIEDDLDEAKVEEKDEWDDDSSGGDDDWDDDWND